MMNRDDLLRRISALDFFIVDMNLYLNTHPADRDAMMKFNAVVKEAKELREEYERRFGALMAVSAAGKVPWQWIDNPWPWQYQFNFDLTGDER